MRLFKLRRKICGLLAPKDLGITLEFGDTVCCVYDKETETPWCDVSVQWIACVSVRHEEDGSIHFIFEPVEADRAQSLAEQWFLRP